MNAVALRIQVLLRFYAIGALLLLAAGASCGVGAGIAYLGIHALGSIGETNEGLYRDGAAIILVPIIARLTVEVICRHWPTFEKVIPATPGGRSR